MMVNVKNVKCGPFLIFIIYLFIYLFIGEGVGVCQREGGCVCMCVCRWGEGVKEVGRDNRCTVAVRWAADQDQSMHALLLLYVCNK